MYQKEILYLYLFRHGVKDGCVGFLKSEEKRDGHFVSLQIRNVSDAFAGTFPVRIRADRGWQEVGQVQLRQGYGSLQQKGTESFAEVEIPLSEEYTIRGLSKKHYKGILAKPLDNGNTKEAAAQEIERKTTKIPEQASRQIKKEELQKAVGTERTFEPEKPVGRINEAGSKLMAASDSYPILWEDKWEQLMHSYDQIHPYGDERVYIKLEPKDFTVLRSGYQHLVNNSFLLHGFYNYRYLILGKEKDFYIGVPGVFYEREKMVAMMFGFEAFECEGGTAEEGKFGYYLRKVEL